MSIHPAPAEITPELVKALPILHFFHYVHLPPHLQAISKPFCELAINLATSLKAGPELAAGLRKLLEAKDCAVRAALYQ